MGGGTGFDTNNNSNAGLRSVISEIVNQIASIPVIQLGGGGYFMSYPIKKDDTGWILASDRDISIFLQSGDASRPQTFRKQNFADSLFVPDSLFDNVIDAEDQNNAVWQSKDSTVRIALWPEFVKLTAPRGLGINVQPTPSTIFNMASTTKASIPWPRMTTAQRNAIPSPVEGMVVWNTTTHALSTYNGTTWS